MYGILYRVFTQQLDLIKFQNNICNACIYAKKKKIKI